MVGTDLVGARGLDAKNQRKIDRTVAGICAAEIWTRDECKQHGDETQ